MGDESKQQCLRNSRKKTYCSQATYQIVPHNMGLYYRTKFQVCNTFKLNVSQHILFKIHAFKKQIITSGYI